MNASKRDYLRVDSLESEKNELETINKKLESNIDILNYTIDMQLKRIVELETENKNLMRELSEVKQKLINGVRNIP